MKIGVTSQNFRTITGHAGKTRRFLVYSVSDNGECHADERLDLDKSMSLHEFKGDEHPLYSLDVLITSSCGDGFVNRMAANGVKVVATAETDPLTAASQYAKGEALLPPTPHTHDHEHEPGEDEHHETEAASPFKVQIGKGSIKVGFD